MEQQVKDLSKEKQLVPDSTEEQHQLQEQKHSLRQDFQEKTAEMEQQVKGGGDGRPQTETESADSNRPTNTASDRKQSNDAATSVGNQLAATATFAGSKPSQSASGDGNEPTEKNIGDDIQRTELYAGNQKIETATADGENPAEKATADGNQGKEAAAGKGNKPTQLAAGVGKQPTGTATCDYNETIEIATYDGSKSTDSAIADANQAPQRATGDVNQTLEAAKYDGNETTERATCDRNQPNHPAAGDDNRPTKTAAGGGNRPSETATSDGNQTTATATGEGSKPKESFTDYGNQLTKSSGSDDNQASESAAVDGKQPTMTSIYDGNQIPQTATGLGNKRGDSATAGDDQTTETDTGHDNNILEAPTAYDKQPTKTATVDGSQTSQVATGDAKQPKDKANIDDNHPTEIATRNGNHVTETIRIHGNHTQDTAAGDSNQTMQMPTDGTDQPTEATTVFTQQPTDKTTVDGNKQTDSTKYEGNQLVETATVDGSQSATRTMYATSIPTETIKAEEVMENEDLLFDQREKEKSASIQKTIANIKKSLPESSGIYLEEKKRFQLFITILLLGALTGFAIYTFTQVEDFYRDTRWQAAFCMPFTLLLGASGVLIFFYRKRLKQVQGTGRNSRPTGAATSNQATGRATNDSDQPKSIDTDESEGGAGNTIRCVDRATFPRILSCLQDPLQGRVRNTLEQTDHRGQHQEQERVRDTILEMGNEDNGTKTLPSLGHSFKLGMLYDCRADRIIPGVTLWDLETMRAHRDVSPQPKTKCQIIVSDSIDDKFSALNVSGDLKASLLGGLIQLQGSAKYLDDKKKSQQQARVTLQYSATTRIEQLNMSHLWQQNISHSHVIDQGMATHVVIAIVFGAQAFFLFDREVSSSESTTDVQSQMEAKIRFNPMFEIDGNVSLKISDEEKANEQQFSCTFYGDYSLPSNPTTYQDAIDIYTSLPQRLGKNGEHAVPMTVCVYPLNKLDTSAARLVTGINVNLISHSQAFLETLNEVDMRCSDMMKEFATFPFPKIQHKLQSFRASSMQHREGFQKCLARVLPSIRGGEVEEGILADILISKEQSPLGSQRMTEWLDNKQQEMSVVRGYLTQIKDIKSVTHDKIGAQILDMKVQYVICFVFTSLDQEDKYLAEIDNYLQAERTGKATQATLVDPGHDAWFCSSHSMWECARSFLDFYTANRADKSKTFIVSSVPDKEHSGASIYLYERGTLVSRCFEPPAKPVTPIVCGRSHDSVSLTLQPATSEAGHVVSYFVEYCNANQEAFASLTISDLSDPCTITGLSPYTEYQLRYRTVSKQWVSLVSDSVSVTTLPTSAPGRPSVAQMEGFHAKVIWETPSVVGDCVTIQNYKIQYQESRDMSSAGCNQRQDLMTKDSECLYILPALKPSTRYTLSVSAVCGQAGESAPSQEASLRIENKGKSLAKRYTRDSKLLAKGSPSIYQLQMQRITCENKDKPGKYSFGKESTTHAVKTIMVLGATGSGKSTLINAMVNYILGVEWDDDFRYKLIHEETNTSQAESQTSAINAYELNHQKGFRIPYSLVVIDTPGFGDTGGITRDRTIMTQMKEFFTSKHGIDQIDTICFVTQASLARLSPTQKYIFDSILSIFGKDIAENIRVLVTFADGQLPPVLDAINKSEIPCPRDSQGRPLHLKFNNSAIFANTGTSGNCESDEEQFDEMFWKMGFSSMKKFFAALGTMESKSLRLTKEVLKERQQLDATVQGLQPQINVGLSKLEEIRKTKQMLQLHEDEIKAHQDFEYEITITVPVEEDVSKSGSYITNCQQCRFTCHYPCGIADDRLKRGCVAMDRSSGYCTVCSGKCIWSVHFNQKYKFDYVKKTEKRTYKDLKMKYEKASGEKMTKEKVVQKLEVDFFLIEDKVVELVETLSCCLARLKEIALRPNPLSTPEYIDLLIEAEKQEAKPGYTERIKSLNEVKKQAELLAKVANNQSLLPHESEKYEQQQQVKQSLGKRKQNWFMSLFQ